MAKTPKGSLTTNQGVVVADNQNTLKSGGRGASILEDFAFREKITHFDHERIPERIVHARGSGAHGYFEVTNPIPHLTRASFLAEKGKKTAAELHEERRQFQRRLLVGVNREEQKTVIRVLEQVRRNLEPIARAEHHSTEKRSKPSNPDPRKH